MKKYVFIPATLIYALHLAYLAYGFSLGGVNTSYFAMAGYGSMFIFTMSRIDSIKQKLLLLLGAAAIETLRAVYMAHIGSPLLGAVGIGPGILAVFVLWGAAFRRHFRDADINYTLVYFMLIQSFLIFSIGFIQHVALVPYTFDARLYGFDLELGFNLPAMLGTLFDASPPIRILCRTIYMLLPAALIFGFAIEHASSGKSPVKILEAFMWGSLVGILYYAVPACGPGQSFGALFPHTMPPQFTPPANGLDPKLWRNAMPSLHMLWTLILWFNAWYFYPARYKYLFALFGILTAMATMGLGEHYLIDLVVALPLAVMVYGAAFHAAPLANKARMRAIIGGGLMGGAWLVILAGTDWQFVPMTAWGMVIATVAASLLLLRKLVGTCRTAK